MTARWACWLVALILEVLAGRVMYVETSGIRIYDHPVHECKKGHGYPPFCPRPGEPRNRTRCCRHITQPSCCEERASRVCMRQAPTGWRRGGTDIDPDPAQEAIFCPGPQDPDYYDVCCWRKYTSFCCSRYITPQIFGGVFGGLALLSIVAALGIYVLKRKGSLKMVKSREDMREQQRPS